MRVSQFLLSTVKETPSDAVVISHQLMLRAGMIRKLASGLYSWLPLGLRVLKKVEKIVREEMDRAGALEVLMPVVQPAELWQESTRWEFYGPDLLRFKDRHQNEFCLGPTHEEIITDIARREIRSYKQLPINFYQIQTKFRDEIRPRFGVMRAREFTMKDAYSFHLDKKSLEKTYQIMYEAYSRIFTRIGLDFRAVQADTGNIGGYASHEFHVLASSGEDAIAFSSESDYAANVELAPSLPIEPAADGNATLEKIHTPNQRSIEEVCQFLNCNPQQTIKTLLVKGQEHKVVALLLRGDHELNEIKASKHPLVHEEFEFASAEDVRELSGCAPGSVGPVGLNCPIVADYACLGVNDFICGANEDDYHIQGVNWQRDIKSFERADLRKVVEGDPSPDGKGRLSIVRGIEVGHIFQLGTKYSEAMGATCLDESGKSVIMPMGCYGIGVSRIVAAAIEQNHDENGIIWPSAIAPFELVILPMNMHKSARLQQAVEALYHELKQAGMNVLLDDRNVRAGFMFADMDLIGIPHRIVMGEKGLDKGVIEYKGRQQQDSEDIPLEAAVTELKNRLGQAL